MASQGGDVTTCCCVSCMCVVSDVAWGLLCHRLIFHWLNCKGKEETRGSAGTPVPSHCICFHTTTICLISTGTERAFSLSAVDSQTLELEKCREWMRLFLELRSNRDVKERKKKEKTQWGSKTRLKGLSWCIWFNVVYYINTFYCGIRE